MQVCRLAACMTFVSKLCSEDMLGQYHRPNGAILFHQQNYAQLCLYTQLDFMINF